MTLHELSIPGAPGGSPSLRSVLGVPDPARHGSGALPGVVLVHEAFGVDEVMRRQVERVAQAGFLALMPDLFSQGGARKCLRATFRDLVAGQGRAFVDIDSARSYLATDERCTGRVGVLGFCMGGAFALVAASGHGFEASSVNYGQLPNDLDAVLEGACPIVASYGARDLPNRGAARRLASALTRHEVAHDVKEYPRAGHSFLNDARNLPGPAIGGWFAQKVLHVGPEPESAADAWRRIEAFFATHLG